MKFFASYEKYVEGNEPPHNFHVWTGISVISALLGKKCYIPQGMFTIHPHLYIILVGRAGMKKSTAMNVGKSILKQIEDFPVAPSSTTREALLQCLAQNKIEYKYNGRDLFYHQLAAFATELEQFIGGKHINDAMIGIMTALWDEPTFEYVTANKPPVIIENPYFTLLACCTKHWISDKLKGNVITDGFSRRCIFVLEEQKAGFQSWPTLTDEKATAMESVIQESLRMRTITGKFRYTDKALEYWNDVLYPRLQSAVGDKDPYVENYYDSKHILMLKVSMCLSAATSNSRIVDSALLKIVEEIFEITEKNLMAVFEGLGRNVLAPYQERIYRFIHDRMRDKNEITERRHVLEQFSRDMSIEEIAEALTFLEETKRIKLHNPQLMNYKPTEVRKFTERKNIFEVLRSYEPDLTEKCSESETGEISRMMDIRSFRRLSSAEERVELLRKGILARASDLSKVQLRELD